MEQWHKQPVADLLAEGILYIGDGYRAKLEELGPRGLPFARAGNIDGGFDFENADRFPEEDLAKVGTKVSQAGDVVFTSKGTVGRFAFVRETTPHFVYSPQLCFWRVLRPDRIYPRFLFYWMSGREFYAQYKGVAGQTDMADYVSLADQRQMHITLPSPGEQRTIAHILGVLDDKIELNRRVNETLEAMARAIFKSWFVDFDPVRAKGEGRQPYGLDAETAALFPDSLQDSPLGKIPKGWRAATLDEGFVLTMGQSPPGYTYNEEGNGILFFQGRSDFGFRYPSRRVYCTAPTRFASACDTLVSVRAPVGEINMAAEKCCIGRGIAAVRHRGGSRSYTYYAMHSLASDFARFEAEGTVFGSINKKAFEQLAWIIPPPEMVDAFEKLAYPLDQMIEANEAERNTLAIIRDSLLPKLIAGEIRVKNGNSTDQS